MTFKSATSYALKDPTRYDDEYGEGYGRVENYGTSDGMSITDCWVTNDRGDIHPGMIESPVPVRFEDVDANSARTGVNDRQRSSMAWA